MINKLEAVIINIEEKRGLEWKPDGHLLFARCLSLEPDDSSNC